MRTMLLAHGLASAAAGQWEWEPLTICLLLASAWAYLRGVTVLWNRAGRGVGISRGQAAAFAAGLATIALALLSPLAWLSDALFSAHMAQHEMLMLVAAPLLVLGRPLQAFLWALPPSQRETVGAWTRRPSVSTGWHAASGPAAACALHALALWIWHVPALFEAALADDLVHGLQHASFLVTAALFWWGMVQGRYGRLGYGVSVVYVFVTAVHSSLLGALVTLADGLWYPSYLEDARVWQVDALQDQQLAGLLMWIPSGLVFIVFGLALFAAWLGESERRARLGRAVPPLGLALLLTGTVTACTPSYDADARALTGGEPSRGREAIGRYGCGACHDIPGVRNATGTVGPSLALVARRAYLAGQVSNTPAGMMRWIQHPQQIERGTVMPEMGVTEQDARDITAYLYTLR